jgi:hypothetical protein
MKTIVVKRENGDTFNTIDTFFIDNAFYWRFSGESRAYFYKTVLNKDTDFYLYYDFCKDKGWQFIGEAE